MKTYERVHEVGRVCYPYQMALPSGEGYHVVYDIPMRISYTTCDVFGMLQTATFRNMHDFNKFVEIVS